MKVKTGYLYFLKDEFYEKIKDESIMSSKGKGHNRPTYFTIEDAGILWFIPLSKQLSKYKRILDYKSKNGYPCDYILIRKVTDSESVILIQNAFPLWKNILKLLILEKASH